MRSPDETLPALFVKEARIRPTRRSGRPPVIRWSSPTSSAPIASLPPALVPYGPIILPAFPATPGGKIDRAALAAHVPTGSQARRNAVRACGWRRPRP